MRYLLASDSDGAIKAREEASARASTGDGGDGDGDGDGAVGGASRRRRRGRLSAAGARGPEGEVPAFFTVDVDEHGELAKTFGVHNVPHVAFLRFGRWYTLRNGEMVPRTQATGLPRYEGYLAASPAAAWVNEVGDLHAKGLAVEVRPVVTELTPETFDAAVHDEGKHVVVAFTAKWCGHCKAFKPYYFEVGAEFSETEDVVVANFDAGEHRAVALRYNVSGFPSVLLWPKAYKSRPLVFKGERKPKALMDFVRSPAAYLAEARASDLVRSKREAENEAKLHAERSAAVAAGGAPLPDGNSASATNEQTAAAALDAAHALARRRMWDEALVELLTIMETPSLRNTGMGGSPHMWNLLDNVKYNIEVAARRQLGYATADDDAASDADAMRHEAAEDLALPEGYLEALADYSRSVGESDAVSGLYDSEMPAVRPDEGSGGAGEAETCSVAAAASGEACEAA